MLKKRLTTFFCVLNWEVRPSGTWCRHSFATNLRNAGVVINYISESMGHFTNEHSRQHVKKAVDTAMVYYSIQ